MSGPRKQKLQSGWYAAHSLGEAQPRKRGRFERSQPCRLTPHAWLFGAECAVCSVCGVTVPKSEVILSGRNERPAPAAGGTEGDSAAPNAGRTTPAMTCAPTPIQQTQKEHGL